LYMYSVEPVVVSREKYIRLWLLYRNYSQTPYDLNPARCIRLHMKGRKHSYRDIEPEPPSTMLESVNNEDAIKQSAMMVGRPLEGVGEKDEGIRGGIVQSLIDGTIGPLPGFMSRDPGLPLFIYFIIECGKDVGKYSGTKLYDNYTKSVNDGILKRHLVYPNNSVNGYMYFPFPGLNWRSENPSFPEAWEYAYTLEIMTQTGSSMIEFTPGGR
jgi:hypothetical protein